MTMELESLFVKKEHLENFKKDMERINSNIFVSIDSPRKTNVYSIKIFLQTKYFINKAYTERRYYLGGCILNIEENISLKSFYLKLMSSLALNLIYLGHSIREIYMALVASHLGEIFSITNIWSLVSSIDFCSSRFSDVYWFIFSFLDYLSCEETEGEQLGGEDKVLVSKVRGDRCFRVCEKENIFYVLEITDLKKNIFLYSPHDLIRHNKVVPDILFNFFKEKDLLKNIETFKKEDTLYLKKSFIN